MKRITVLVYLIASLIITPPMCAMMPQLSSGEMQQLEQLEKQLMQEIDQYVSSLSPEEQRKFHEAVEEETRKIEQMQPDELNSYIEDTFSGIEESLKAPEAPVAPAKPGEPVKTETKENIVKPEETEKQARAVNLIDSLIKQLESYLLKINVIPDISAKLPKWAQQGRVVGWNPDMTFNSFKKEVEAFNQQLHKLKKRDEKTKKYIFLSDLLENEALLNNLAKINNTLKHWEPQIKLRTQEFESVTTESKKAIIQATNTLLEGLTILAAPKAIDDIIVKYDPIAKQKREEEEKSRKRALEESKRGPRPVARSIGTDPSGAAGSYYPGAGYGDMGYSAPRSRGYSGGGYSPQYGYDKGASYTPSRSGQPAQATGRPSSGVGTPSRFDTKKPKDTKGLGALGADGKPQKVDDKEKDKKTVTQPELTEQAKRRINAVADSLERALDRLEKAKLLKPFETLNSPKELDPREVQVEIEYALRAVQYLEDAVSAVRRLSITGSVKQKQLYAKKLNTMLEDSKRHIATLTEQIKKVKEKENDFSAEKRYVYLGGQKTLGPDEEVDENFKKIDKPFNIYKIAQLMEELKSAITSLSSGQTVS